MDMDQAAVFFAASVLTALGFLIWVGFILLVNNIVHKYWKSWGWSLNVINPQPVRFMSEDEAAKIEPQLKK